MRLRLLAGLVGALALAACNTPSAGPPAAPSTSPPPATSPDGPRLPELTPEGAEQPRALAVADAVTVKGTQGLILAELAYNTAGETLKRAVTVGLVRPGTPLAQRLRTYNSTASRALEVARVARTATEQAAEVARAMSAIVSLRAQTPATGGR